MIELNHISKTYMMGVEEVRAIDDISLTIKDGELSSIVGPSGSGKSTLMNIIGCLDMPTSGSYRLDGVEVIAMSDTELARIRGRMVGFVFQTFNLLPRLSALANVELPLVYQGVPKSERTRRAKDVLERVELANRINHKPSELSGGERQRVAIARALVNNPVIILADEPTGNLDTKVGAEIIRLFKDLNEQSGVTVLIVTHDHDIAQSSRRVIRLTDGKVVSDIEKGDT